ncbi:MAG: KH domain-containing protein [Conexivisphaerales archaeon]
MSFRQVVRVPKERVAVVIGKGGETKRRLEELLGVKITIYGETGDVAITSNPDVSALESDPFKAVQIIEAIGRGFSPERSERLLDGQNYLETIDLRDYVGKSKNALERVRGRIIGLNGKARRVLEELTGAYISVYGHTVACIGSEFQNKLATSAIIELAQGSEHKVVYSALQRERTKAKLERLKLWED